jgi:hypothetical protein
MEPAGYFRRLVHEPHETVAPVTRQQDLFALAHLGVPHVIWRDGGSTSRAP